MRSGSYQRLAMKTDKFGDDIRSAGLQLASEAGEVAGKICKLFRDGDGTMTGLQRLAILDECGDTLWSLTKIVDYLGYELETVMERNIEKLADRASRDVISGEGDNR